MQKILKLLGIFRNKKNPVPEKFKDDFVKFWKQYGDFLENYEEYLKIYERRKVIQTQSVRLEFIHDSSKILDLFRMCKIEEDVKISESKQREDKAKKLSILGKNR